MFIFHENNQKRGFVWDWQYPKLDQTKMINWSSIYVDEGANNPKTLDIEKYYWTSKYYFQNGEFHEDLNYIEPVELPPIIPPKENPDPYYDEVRI